MTDNLKQRIAEAIYPYLNENLDTAQMAEAAQAVLDIVEPMIRKWLPFPENKPELYEGLKVSYPLLFEYKDLVGKTFVALGFYDDDNKFFTETRGNLVATRFMHFNLPTAPEKE